MTGARALAYQALRGIGAALLGFAAMTVVAALGLAALCAETPGAASPALVAAVVTAAVSGGPFVLTLSPESSVTALPLGLRAELTATPLGVAGAGTLCLALALLRAWPHRTSPAPADAGRPSPIAAQAIRVVSALVACLGLLALTAAAARGSIAVSAGGLRTAFGPRVESVLTGGLVRTGLVLLMCPVLARPTPVRPAVRAVLGVCAGVALVATLLGVTAVRPTLPGAGAAVLGAPNVAFGALSAAAGFPAAAVPHVGGAGAGGAVPWAAGIALLEAAFAARERAQARMRRFVADVSHELRTPLFGIKGFAELHRMGGLPDVDLTLDRVESEAGRLVRLVEDLLLLARLDEGEDALPMDLAPMDLRTLAADAHNDLRTLDPGRDVTLTGPDGGPPGEAPVFGDEARLRQVISNLVGNAVAHTPPGTPVRIGVGTTGGDGVLVIADEGPGMPEEEAARVFDRFYRVDGSRSRTGTGGAGLGLAIVRSIVTAHGGRVELRTRPGAGAAFRVVLPREGLPRHTT
ncbi:sensor histidine kinase [Microbispora siamensis]